MSERLRCAKNGVFVGSFTITTAQDARIGDFRGALIGEYG